MLEGAAIKFVPGVDKPLKETDKIVSILALSVVGSLVEAPLHFGPTVFRPLVEDCIDPTKFSPLALSRVIKEKIISDLNFLIRKPEQPPKDRLQVVARCRASGRRRLISTMARCRRSPIC